MGGGAAVTRLLLLLALLSGCSGEWRDPCPELRAFSGVSVAPHPCLREDQR